MKKENLNTLYNEVEKAYGFINDFLGNHGLDMIDLAYPNHDGVQDADVAADMMLLRQSTITIMAEQIRVWKSKNLRSTYMLVYRDELTGRLRVTRMDGSKCARRV